MTSLEGVLSRAVRAAELGDWLFRCACGSPLFTGANGPLMARTGERDRSVDSRTGVRARSDQFVTSAAFLWLSVGVRRTGEPFIRVAPTVAPSCRRSGLRRQLLHH
jgi:hypothetical protein